ncbi:hypothetical protein QBC45DRAFT_219342 [Copromyces sp. CBS 386.78]|nr:hypothetical protein QBC45DRAFT_219342 [Copromyces sp. CBS 386.78]
MHACQSSQVSLPSLPFAPFLFLSFLCPWSSPLSTFLLPILPDSKQQQKRHVIAIDPAAFRYASINRQFNIVRSYPPPSVRIQSSDHPNRSSIQAVSSIRCKRYR